MSRAVVCCSGSGRPDALWNVVRLMPNWRARAVIRSANRSSLPARFSAIAQAMSLAERVTSAMIASSTRIVEPARRPSLVGGIAAARGEMTKRESSVNRPVSRASNSK